MTGDGRHATAGLPPRRFAAVGLVATVVDVGVAVALAEAGLTRALADVISLGLAAVVSLQLHDRYTLRGDRLDRWIRRPKVFVAVALVAGLLDLVVFVALDTWTPLAAKLVAVACAAMVRAVAHRTLLFRAVHQVQGVPAHRARPAGDARLSVVVPAYHEVDGIGATLRRLRTELADLDAAGDLEIVVVDDGSGDGTAAAARAGGASRVVEHDHNRGKGAAVRTGIAAATGRTIAFTDADLAYPPQQLRVVLAEIERGFDVVIGDRRHAESDTVTATSRLRSFGSSVVNAATHVLLLGNYRDTQCGCKAFRSDVARVVAGPGVVDGFAFDIEILHLVERYGLSLSEVPVEVTNSSTSTVRAVRDGLAVGRDILRIRRRSRRGGYPALPDDALPPAGRPSPPAGYAEK